MPKTRIELLASLATLNARRPGLATLVEDGRAQEHELTLVDKAIRQTEAQIAALDQSEAETGAQPRQDGRRAKPAVDFDHQRQTLLDLREQRQGELCQLAETRRKLLLDGTAAEVRAVEAQMAEKTADADRIRDSLVELDRREAAAETRAQTTERKRSEADLDGKLKRLGVLGGKLADAVEAMVPLLAEIDQLEHEAAALAGSLGRRLGSLDRRRPLLSRVLCGRLGVKEAAFFISPADLERVEAKLRSAPVVPPAPGDRQSGPQRGEVPFVEGPDTREPDHAAEATIAAQQARAKAMTAGR